MPPFEIPGYEYAGVYDLDTACWLFGGACFLWQLATITLPDPADLACLEVEAHCISAETVEQLSNGDCDPNKVWVYKKKSVLFPGPPTIVIPKCAYPDVDDSSNKRIDEDQ